MALFAVILDTRPNYLCDAPKSVSLLSLPAGSGTVLGMVASCASSMGAIETRVLPDFPWDRQYEQAIRNKDDTVLVGSGVLELQPGEYEPSDSVLVVDPCCWPVGGLDRELIVEHRGECCWAVHAVSIASAGGGALEYIHDDGRGRIRRIGRYYDHVSCSKIRAIAYSLVPLSSLDGQRFTSLHELRTGLTSRGMLGRDVPLPDTVFDLTNEGGVLGANEQLVAGAFRNGLPQGYRLDRPGVLIGQDCRVHPSVRLVPPIIIQQDTSIEEGASIIGPTVVGRGSRVGRGSVVAQSVVVKDTTVEPGATWCQRIVTDRHPSHAIEVPGGTETGASAPGRTGGQPIVPSDPGLEIREWSRRRFVYPAVKLAVDVAAAAIGLVLLSPLLAVIAVLIKLDSRGPALFRHDREGKDRKVFACLKFRTMQKEAHRLQRSLYKSSLVDGPQFKLVRDPRITRVGRWLRRTSLDELPQLINVLRGQMSLVGPRPSPFRENQICIPWRQARLSVRPGITGLWQMCRCQRDTGDFHQWITYDVAYVRRMSWWVDLKILFFTVVTLGGQRRIPASWIIGTDPSGAPTL